jgi:hypothetical protein
LALSATLFTLSVGSFQYSLYLVPHRAWLYLAIVLYLCALGMLWLLLWRSEREAALKLKDGFKAAEKVGALRMLADEVDGLVSTLRGIFQWIDKNDKRSRSHLERPLDEAFRHHLGMNWGEGQDRLTSFQESYKAHRSRMAKYCPDFETQLTRQEHSMLRKLTDKEFGDLLILHSTALRAESSRILGSVSVMRRVNPKMVVTAME